MKIIISFGNIGHEYDYTRHNLGFMFLDFYLKTNQLTWHTSQKFHSIWTKSDDLIFLKPQTYYNNVGLAARACADFYKVTASDIFAICDDFNLDFAQIRFRQNGSSGGNNGLKSLAYHLRTTEFPRLRLGTNNHALRPQLGDTEFVLSRFTPAERERLPAFLQAAAQHLRQFI